MAEPLIVRDVRTLKVYRVATMTETTCYRHTTGYLSIEGAKYEALEALKRGSNQVFIIQEFFPTVYRVYRATDATT